MKVLTWNINGIRASNREVPLKKLLESLEADVICLQETKVTRDQLDEATAIVDGYNAFFSFSKIKGGYSGVATFCKTEVTPTAVEEGLTGLLNNGSSSSVIGCSATSLSISQEELASLDAEGRAILSEHEILGHRPIVIVNLYCPRADRDNEKRWAFKQNFYHLVQARCEALLSSGKDVMIVGDLNVSHTKLDHCDPDADPEYFASNDSRIWMSQFLLPSSELALTEKESQSNQFSLPKSVKSTEAYEDFDDAEELSDDAEQVSKSNRQRRFVDVFRYFHRTREYAFTCWSTVTGARKTNYGTRIDYILVNKEFLMKYAVSCDIRPDIHGSDHCPVVAVFSCSVKAAETLPDMCTTYMPEFRGRQKSIKAFFQTGPKQTASSEMKMRSETLACAQTVTDPRTFGNNGNKDNSKKRKADKEKSQNPAKVQKTGMKASQTETGSNRSLASYFQKSIANTQKNKKVDKKEILDFFTEAKITDSSLKEEIFRDTFGSLADTKANECCKGGAIGVTEMNEMNEKYNTSNSGENNKEGSEHDEMPSLTKQKTLSNCIAHINSTFSTGCATEKKNEETGKTGGKIMQWKSILKGPEPPPLCEGHKEDCVLRTVKKQGPNLGRQFYCCARPEGRANDKEARCKTFKWRKK
ncbi:DNA-(apurinic or apyrimidinic site) endonuclease 2-like [Rhopilema esculentum]|uniref:DNA-(apurinic or apyrimidinic site) endonuclease 2-like n=1 Tax=Rhopilema esculentum TaxID=499914 RepID=UPI0031D815EF